MSTPVVRYLDPQGSIRWGVVFAGAIAPLPQSYETTADFISNGGAAAARLMTAQQVTTPLDAVTLLAPITSNQQFLCQGVNYASHVRESGLDPAQIPFNMFFTKASSSLTGPNADVKRPAHVRLLDYEIELGLVIGRPITNAVSVAPDRLHEWLAGVTIVNDVSARDVQLPQGQFYKGKSYRGFGPVGPYLLLLEPQEWLRWPQLHMRLMVNGQLRQDAYCDEMIYKPHQTLSEYSALQDLMPGDLIATGTPAGCAARAPGRLQMLAAKVLLSERKKWQIFVKRGGNDPAFLKPNDIMTLSIRTDDGALDLGEQCSKVVAA